MPEEGWVGQVTSPEWKEISRAFFQISSSHCSHRQGSHEVQAHVRACSVFLGVALNVLDVATPEDLSQISYPHKIGCGLSTDRL